MRLYLNNLPIQSNSMLQFYLSIISFELDLTFLRVFSVDHRLINVYKIKYPKQQIKKMLQLLPKPITFKDNSEKNDLVNLIRNLIVLTFYRNRCNFNIGIQLPTREHLFGIIPILYKNAFTIKVQKPNRYQYDAFNICRQNKYSDKSSNLIYDWKEIQKLNDRLESMNLSLKKLWSNLRLEISRKIYNFAISKSFYLSSILGSQFVYYEEGIPFLYRVPIQRINASDRPEILSYRAEVQHFDKSINIPRKMLF